MRTLAPSNVVVVAVVALGAGCAGGGATAGPPPTTPPAAAPIAPPRPRAVGFSVRGHPFLSDLGATEAAAVIEYLKTL